VIPTRSSLRRPVLGLRCVGHSYRVRPEALATGRTSATRVTVLQREKNRWSDRAARPQLDRLIQLRVRRVQLQVRL
jgi:hypothetical protein